MHCVSCKRSTRFRGARYCAWCGAPLQAPLWSGDRPLAVDADDDDGALRVDCRRCGKQNASSYAHCVHCGVRLMADAGSVPPTPEAVQRAADLVAAARQELAAGRRERARSQCEEALALDGRSAAAHALLAEVLYGEGSIGGALQEMTAALRYDPANTAYERRLRELRDEQDRAIGPLLRSLDEPRRPRRAPVRRPPRPMAAPAWKPEWRVGSSLPEWAKAAILIGGAVLLVGLVPLLTSSVLLVLGLVLGIIITLFVFTDARRQGYPQAAALGWAALVCLASFLGARFFGGSAGLVALLAYLLITRSRR